jgi:glutamyl-tRNA(Gln) amidotransferase subunit D
MLETKHLKAGDKVKIKTKTKTWTGHILESYEYEIILLKLETGYNIGIRNSEIIEVKVLEKSNKQKTKPIKLEKKENQPNVAMIITGGTISSRLDQKTGAAKWTTVEDLFKIAPELSNICNITEIKKPFMKGSEDMSLKYWKQIAEVAHKLLLDKNIDGIIITHGTDTLHYGSAALSFFIQKLNKPIAFTYSQRSIDRASTDAHLNLICAAKYATSDIAEIAIVGHKDLNDKTCLALPATKTRKMHTSRRDTFHTINDTPIAEITQDHLEILKEFNAKNDNQPKLDTKYSDKVTLIKIIPNQDPKILDFYADQGYKGIILETTGLGHLPGKDSENNWLPTIKRLIKKGITIAATPQTLGGALNPNVYSTGRELSKTGIIFLKDMLPETAFIKLSWILGHKSWTYNNKNRIKEILLQNISGEYNDKLKFDEF